MKKNMKLNFMLMSGVLLFGMYSCTPGAQDYSSYVNPLSVREDMDILTLGL